MCLRDVNVDCVRTASLGVLDLILILGCCITTMPPPGVFYRSKWFRAVEKWGHHLADLNQRAAFFSRGIAAIVS